MATAVHTRTDDFVRAMSQLWHRVLATGQSTALLPIRLAFGLIFLAHGTQKLFGWFGGGGLSATGEAFANMGFSPGLMMAFLAGVIELFGGLFLMLGLGTRIAASALTVQMLVAMFGVHWQNGFFMKTGGIEFTFALVAGLLAAVIYGGGAASADRAITRR
jgi:putative oxidoreductase